MTSLEKMIDLMITNNDGNSLRRVYRAALKIKRIQEMSSYGSLEEYKKEILNLTKEKNYSLFQHESLLEIKNNPLYKNFFHIDDHKKKILHYLKTSSQNQLRRESGHFPFNHLLPVELLATPINTLFENNIDSFFKVISENYTDYSHLNDLIQEAEAFLTTTLSRIPNHQIFVSFLIEQARNDLNRNPRVFEAISQYIANKGEFYDLGKVILDQLMPPTAAAKETLAPATVTPSSSSLENLAPIATPEPSVSAQQTSQQPNQLDALAENQYHAEPPQLPTESQDTTPSNQQITSSRNVEEPHPATVIESFISSENSGAITNPQQFALAQQLLNLLAEKRNPAATPHPVLFRNNPIATTVIAWLAIILFLSFIGNAYRFLDSGLRTVGAPFHRLNEMVFGSLATFTTCFFSIISACLVHRRFIAPIAEHGNTAPLAEALNSTFSFSSRFFGSNTSSRQEEQHKEKNQEQESADESPNPRSA